MSSDEDEGLANLFQTLERRSYKTYSARLQASRRLASRNRAWNASLIATSTATTIASVALLTDSSIYGRSGPTLLVCTAILTLIASLVASGLDYSGRSRDMFLNYRRLQRLSAEVERYVCSAGLQSREVLETLHEGQLSNVVDLAMRNDQAATLSSCVVVWSSVTLMPSVNFAPSSTSATSSWPLNRRQRSCADSSSL